ncbi:TDT family transporter [Shewanella mesophila]|uniref:TDT family transporter n=1 Tax=Shewanella mesophila TaxID=2864208 RepID=UPI001C661F88|nr:TDT family transporter [Shewanella mesophila]QYJ87511.1 TDT family transporter [Shewanella mesophila]
MKNRITALHRSASSLPSPMAGLALAIASLGWAWDSLLPQYDGLGQTIGTLIACMLLSALMAKFLLHPKVLKEELTHPVVGSVIPTFAMALMVVSNTLWHHNPVAGKYLWLIAIAIHLIFLSIFAYYRALDFKLEQMVPSWFVPPIGIIVAAVSFPNDGYHWLATATLMFGMGCYLVMLPLMLYRLIFCPKIPDAAKPTIAILAAPASLSLAGYLTIVEQPSATVVTLLLTVAILMTSIIYLALFHLLKLPFSPGYAAFTFPMVIGATALLKTYQWMLTKYGMSNFAVGIEMTAIIELIVASVIVAYVSYKYIDHYR